MTKKQLTPFHDKKGKLHWPYKAMQSIAFIFPTPPAETIGEEGRISLPEEYREWYQDGTGILLSVGPGYYDEKDKWHPTDPKLVPGTKVYFNNEVPWDMWVYGQDKKKYRVVTCVEADIQGIVGE